MNQIGSSSATGLLAVLQAVWAAAAHQTKLFDAGLAVKVVQVWLPNVNR
jgi:hypothetical protein